MFKSLLTKGLAMLLFVLLGLNQSFAQAFWTEDFSDQASSTSNWTNGGTNTGTEDWTWTNDPLAGFMDPSIPGFGTGGYFLFNSDANGEGNPHDVTLTGVGVPADCSGKTGVHVTFNTQYAYAAAGALAEVGVSTNGTDFTYYNPFEGLASNAIADGLIDIAIPQADGAAQVWIQFRWIGEWEFHWKVDDVTLYEYVAPNYDVTFRVNASTITVDPAGMKLAGTFSNFADLDMVDGGNGIWSYTVSLTEGVEAQYKFKNGPTGWESGNAACGVDDGFGGFNRVYTATADATLAAVCFNECGPCPVVNVPCDMNPNSIICDNFDSYSTAMRLAAQSPTNWTTWSGAVGTAEDGIISTDFAFSGANSMKIEATAQTGGPQDVVLKLQNKTAGHYELNWKIYVPAGKAGYYNIQNVVPIAGGAWNLDVFFNIDGTGSIQVGAGPTLATFTYNQGEWVDVEHEIDLDNNLLTLHVGGQYVKKMAFPNNLGGIDFFGTDGNNLYYIDNVEYIELAPVVYNADICESAVDITASMGNASGVVTTVGPYDITNATLDPVNDPTTGFECFLVAAAGDPQLNGNHWFTFVGDGNRYNITTSATACGGSPLPDGDTQFALYTGSCGDYTPVDCNDDISTSDYRSTLSFDTEAGVVYYLMVDSWNGGDGTYCLDITQEASVDCAAGEIGVHTVANDGIICWGDNLNTYLEVDPSTYVLPNIGPVYGHLWCISTSPVDPNVWPGSIPGIASTTANPDIILVNLPNDGTFTPGVYYLTSVVVAGGELIDPAGLARVFNIADPVNGCFFVGESIQMTLVPQLDDLVAFESYEVNPDGTINIDLTVDGGFGGAVGDPTLYNFNWSNGATTPSLSNVPNAAYSVTISDLTGCVADFVINTTVGTNDPSSVKALTMTPNPTTGLVNLNMTLATAADVQVDVINALGQNVQTIQAGRTASINQTLDLTTAASGTYTVRIRMDNETAVRRIVVQH